MTDTARPLLPQYPETWTEDEYQNHSPWCHARQGGHLSRAACNCGQKGKTPLTNTERAVLVVNALCSALKMAGVVDSRTLDALRGLFRIIVEGALDAVAKGDAP